jgi:chemotaxis protein CheD
VVRVGELAVGEPPALLATYGLGSCVAVLLHDPASGIGGLAHVLLPYPSSGRGPGSPGRYAISAVPSLIGEMLAVGARRRELTARLVGGASMFASLAAPGTIQIGDRNILATRDALKVEGVPVLAESVGGDYGRSVELSLPGGEVLVTSYAHDPESL